MALIDKFPIWAVYLVTVALVLLAAEIGFRTGLWLRRRDPAAGEASMTAAVVGGTLGLMAFLMAFTIGIVIDQHNGRKAMVVEESNAVGTAWLRAGFLEEPDQTGTRDLLQEYVEIRLAAGLDPTQYESMAARSGEIHAELWMIVEETFWQGNDSDIFGLFVESINDVIDVHTLRLTAANLRLPRLLGIMLFIATFLSFLLVGIASSRDGKRDTAAIILFALTFVAVLMVVVDLDRPSQGLLTISQSAMSDLLEQMKATGQ